MQTKSILILASSLFALASCTMGGNSSSSGSASASSSSEPYDLSSLASSYGTFKITADSSTEASYTYDETSNVYTLAVSENYKATYTLVGFFNGTIKISNVNSLSSFKGVKLSLEGACLVSESNTSPILYDINKKNVQISAKNKTSNMILSLGSASAIQSENNVEFSGKGALEIYSAVEHGVDAEGSVAVYGESTITLAYSGHDGFHGESLTFADEDDVAFTGKLIMKNIVSQAFDFEADGAGTITVNGGTITVDTAESVFKTESTLLIDTAATVRATNISADPVVKPDDQTELLTVTVNGTFTSDGTAISSQTI